VPAPESRLRTFRAVVALIFLVAGVIWHWSLLGGGDSQHHSITEHTGTIVWHPRGANPDPELAEHFWTWDYPAAYASRVGQGVGIYWEGERIGFVKKSEVDKGTVWVYAFIAPEYAHIAAAAAESEPIETDEGPRVQIYKLFPGSGAWVPPAAHARA
jgi:hypothetical protein